MNRVIVFWTVTLQDLELLCRLFSSAFEQWIIDLDILDCSIVYKCFYMMRVVSFVF